MIICVYMHEFICLLVFHSKDAEPRSADSSPSQLTMFAPSVAAGGTA